MASAHMVFTLLTQPVSNILSEPKLQVYSRKCVPHVIAHFEKSLRLKYFFRSPDISREWDVRIGGVAAVITHWCTQSVRERETANFETFEHIDNIEWSLLIMKFPRDSRDTVVNFFFNHRTAGSRTLSSLAGCPPPKAKDGDQ